MTIEEAYDRGYEAGIMKSSIDAELISDQREVEKAGILRKLNKPISASFRKWAEDYIAKNPTPEPIRFYTEAEIRVANEYLKGYPDESIEADELIAYLTDKP